MIFRITIVLTARQELFILKIIEKNYMTRYDDWEHCVI